MNKAIMALAFLLLTNINLNFSANKYDPKTAAECLELIAKNDRVEHIYLANILLIKFALLELSLENANPKADKKEIVQVIQEYKDALKGYDQELSQNSKLIIKKIDYNYSLMVLLYYVLIEKLTEKDIKDFDLKEDLKSSFPELIKYIEDLNPQN